MREDEMPSTEMLGPEFHWVWSPPSRTKYPTYSLVYRRRILARIIDRVEDEYDIDDIETLFYIDNLVFHRSPVFDTVAEAKHYVEAMVLACGVPDAYKAM